VLRALVRAAHLVAAHPEVMPPVDVEGTEEGAVADAGDSFLPAC